MNWGFLLVAGFTAFALPSEVQASPRLWELDSAGFSVREDRASRDLSRREERGLGRLDRLQDRKDERRGEDPERERGYGYGYERRNLQPRQDDRGRH